MKIQVEDNENIKESRRKIRKYLVIISIIGIALIAGYLILAIIGLSYTKDAVYLSIVIRHYPATIGLPLIAITSLILVYVFEYSRGPIEFSGLGFSFKGAAGPLIFWVICFISISLCVSLVWKSEYDSVIVNNVLEERLTKIYMEKYIENCKWLKDQQGLDMEKVQVQCAEKAEFILEEAEKRLLKKASGSLVERETKN